MKCYKKIWIKNSLQPCLISTCRLGTCSLMKTRTIWYSWTTFFSSKPKNLNLNHNIKVWMYKKTHYSKYMYAICLVHWEVKWSPEQYIFFSLIKHISWNVYEWIRFFFFWIIQPTKYTEDIYIGTCILSFLQMSCKQRFIKML